jgi:hypothetical protein
LIPTLAGATLTEAASVYTKPMHLPRSAGPSSSL